VKAYLLAFLRKLQRIAGLAAAVAVVSGLIPLSVAQQPKYPAVESVDARPIFRAYCASCHGVDGKGHGSVSPALKSRVPDLTLLARRSGGQFPAARVRNILEGREAPSGHGSREMPIWGPVFHHVDGDVDMGHVRVENLVKYIESLQRK